MPKRTDIQSVLVIGSGPIVIGQAAEFDYSGTQACRVLQGRGPAGHPGQLQPGDDHDRPGDRRRHLRRADHPGVRREDHRQGAPRRAAAHPRRPDRPQHRDLHARAGRAGEVRRRADRRQRRGDQQGRGPRPVQGRRRGRPRQDRARRVRPLGHLPLHGRRPRGRRDARRLPRRRPPLLHHGRRRLRLRPRRGGAAPHRRPGPHALPDHRGAPGGVHPRLEGVRAGADARQARQRRGRLLHRELRPDGRAHRRLDHRRARR